MSHNNPNQELINFLVYIRHVLAKELDNLAAKQQLQAAVHHPRIYKERNEMYHIFGLNLSFS